MLIQINDPMSSRPNQEVTYALGIDFGTTHCVAGIVRNNHVELILLDGDSVLLPSVVSYDHESVHVGRNAISSKHPIYSIKRLMGRSKQDIPSILQLYSVQAIPHHEYLTLETCQGLRTPVEIAKEIFQYIREKAQAYLNQSVEQAVVTVPAYFDDVARNAIKQAAQMAGLTVLRLVAEPTAAALAYGLDDDKEGNYIVYDLGGGTFDVSILNMHQGVFQVLATGGDAFLGGDDLDRLIVDFFLKDEELTQDQRQIALIYARQVKERLSYQLKATFDTPLGDRYVLKRDVFEELIAPFIEKTLRLTEDTLQQSGISVRTLQGIILVGGSTRIPKIHSALNDLLQVPIFQSLNPDEVVAMGAAFQANLLTQGGNSLLIDVSPLSLGVEMMGGIVNKIIPRNTPIPISKSQKFTTFKDNQTGIMIHILQGERELSEHCRSLGRFILSGIPPMPSGIARIDVTFTLDADGLLTVTAKEELTGIQQHVTVKPSYGLKEDVMKEMILESHHYAKEDMTSRLLSQAKLDAEQLVTTVETALTANRHHVSHDIVNQIETSLHLLKDSILTMDRDHIQQQTNHLHQLYKDWLNESPNHIEN